MRLVQKTEMLSDATYWLKAEGIPNGFTVEDAIKWVVSLNEREFGSIYLRLEGWQREGLATYRYGKATSENVDVIAQLQGREVDAIEANGGWGQMNYYIKLK